MHPSQPSGRQWLRAMARGELPRASISDTIPMTLASIDAGSVRFTARADKRHLNPLGGVHGGFAATVPDSVTGYAIHSMLEAGVGYGTVDLNVKRVQAVPVDTPLVAEGRVLHVSRTIDVSEGTLFAPATGSPAHASPCAGTGLRDLPPGTAMAGHLACGDADALAASSRRADLMLTPPRPGRDRRCPAGHAPAGAARAAWAGWAG
ncbi:hypothetical protein LMG9673_03408 [Ralstonia pseudosolanacearum]|nr:hypothetical protein LMG9673_03408 [Ralstonia pseudosolanacearum]